jgi:hypothetical protein
MKLTSALFCTCLMLMAGSSFGQDRAKEDSQTEPNPPMNPSSDQQGGMKANDMTHNGMTGSKMTIKQCRDMAAMEKKNPDMNKDPMKHQACAAMHEPKGAVGDNGH